MKRKYHDLNCNEQKLLKLSYISFSLLYGPLFGYSLNKEMFYIWLIMVFAGGVSLLITSKQIRPEMRKKVMSWIIVITVALDIWIFSDFILVPMIIKQLIFFLVFSIFGYPYFKLLFEGKLAVSEDATKHIRK